MIIVYLYFIFYLIKSNSNLLLALVNILHNGFNTSEDAISANTHGIDHSFDTKSNHRLNDNIIDLIYILYIYINIVGCL